MKTLEGHVVLKPWNPNMVWTGEPEYTKITRLYMSVGNGDAWYEYVKRAEITNGLMHLTTYRGKSVVINTNWIVKAEDFTVVRVTGAIEVLPGIYNEKLEERLYLAQDDVVIELR